MNASILQQLLEDLIYHSGICLALHGFHGLSYQKSDGLFLSVVVIFHRLRIIFDHLLDHRSQFTFIVYCLQSFFLHIFVRIDIIFKDLFKYFFGNGAVDRSRFCQFNQFRQIFR